MAAIGWSDVTNHAPELSSVAAGAQTDILSYVNDTHDVSVFLDGEDGHGLKLARIYLAAHLGTLLPTNSSGGQIKSQSAGGLSRSYGPFISGSGLASTSYGVKYNDIVNASSARAPVII